MGPAATGDEYNSAQKCSGRWHVIVMVVLLALACVSPAAPDDRLPAGQGLILDFEDGPLSGWAVPPTETQFVSYRTTADPYRDGHRALLFEARGWPGPSTNGTGETVGIEYRLPVPLSIDTSTEVSWRWWIGDRDENDGVSLTLRFSHELAVSWMSHSNFARGPVDLNDPERQTVSHRFNVAQTLVDRQQVRHLPEGVQLLRIDVEAAFPIEQTMYLDDIRVGPPPIHPAAEPSPAPPVEDAPRVTALAVADLDGDGQLDRITGHVGAPPSVFFGRGTASSFGGELLGLETARSLRSPSFADLNLDGVLDLACICNARLRLFEGLGAGHFRELPAPEIPMTRGPHGYRTLAAVHAVDLLPGNGYELYICRVASMLADTLLIRQERGEWCGLPFPPPERVLNPGHYRGGMAIADVDNDGDLDLYACNADLYLQAREGLVRATTQWLPEAGTHQTGATFGDIDNDSDLDLFITVDIRTHRYVAEEAVTHTHCLLYRNDGDHFTDCSGQLLDGSSPHAGSPCMEDFDLDGDLDIFFVQDHRWEPPQNPGNQRANVHLVNDGTGHFKRAGGSWLAQSPPARSAVVVPDEHGVPGLLLNTWENTRALLQPTMGAPERRPIVVRVLDPRGAPHATGAQLRLVEADGSLAGFRQSGAGSMLPGCGQATFGCRTEGPYTLTVAFPSALLRPLQRTGLRPGDHVTVVEPIGQGFLGESAARGVIAWRRLLGRTARVGGASLFPISLLVGLVCGVGALLWKVRGCRRATMATALAVSVVIGILAWLSWPRYREAKVAGSFMVCGFVVGSAAGGLLAFLDTKRREAIVKAPTVYDHQVRLVGAASGFRHARWAKYMESIKRLATNLGQAADPAAVRAQILERLRDWPLVVRPALSEIEHLLPMAGVEPVLIRRFRSDLAVLDATLPRLAPLDPTMWTSTDLDRIGGAASDLHDLAGELMEDLGRAFNADVAPILEAAVAAGSEHLDPISIHVSIAEGLPRVFAVPSELATILENLVRNAVRAAWESRELRQPRVRIAARLAEDQKVEISVQDTGPGLPADIVARLAAVQVTDPDTHGGGLARALPALKAWDGKLEFPLSPDEDGGRVVVRLTTLKGPATARGRVTSRITRE